MKMSNLEKQFVNSPGHSRQVSHHADRLLKLTQFNVGQNYLDVGCGNGAAPIYVAQKYQLNVTGIDVDPDQIKLARQNSQGLNNVHFMTINGTRVPFDDGEFEIVFTNKVTHHIPNWAEAVHEMIRVLKPGGYFIYSDLIFPGWAAAIGRTLLGSLSGFPTAQELDKIFGQHGLSVVHLSKSTIHYEAVLQKLAV